MLRATASHHSPGGLGYFYGFIGGDVDQWDPTVFENTAPVEPKKGLTGEARANYHLDADLADKAIHWIEQQHSLAPDKPFFVYYAPGATHAPHHVPKDWIAKFKGRFDQGWDRLREETFARQKALGVFDQQKKLLGKVGCRVPKLGPSGRCIRAS